MRAMFKKYIPPAVYAIANCAPIPPIMGINILALFSRKTYTSKTTVISTLLYIAITLPFITIHLNNGVDLSSYITSYLGSIFIIFTSIGAALYVSNRANFEWMIKTTSLFIFIAFIVSSASFLITGDEKILGGWYQHYYTSGVSIYRYGGYMYEASHLCLAIAPLFFYLALNLKKNKANAVYLMILTPPLVATYSAGFFATIIATILIANFSKIKSKKSVKMLVALFLLTAIFIPLIYVSSDTVRSRITNIVTMNDSSVQGRSFDSYTLATQIAEQKSLLFGAGIGQIKIIGNPIIIDFYKYSKDAVDVVRIPSSAAEMLASYGLVGLTLKIILLLYLYARFKVYKNIYSNHLFIFFFLYQLYGSFMLSTIEVFCFALAILISKKELRSTISKRVISNPSIKPIPL